MQSFSTPGSKWAEEWPGVWGRGWGLRSLHSPCSRPCQVQVPALSPAFHCSWCSHCCLVQTSWRPTWTSARACPKRSCSQQWWTLIEGALLPFLKLMVSKLPVILQVLQHLRTQLAVLLAHGSWQWRLNLQGQDTRWAVDTWNPKSGFLSHPTTMLAKQYPLYVQCHPLQQWFSAFLKLQSLNTDPHVVLNPQV